MSVTKAELVRVNERLQEMIRALLHENKTLRAEKDRLTATLISSTAQIETLSVRYQKLASYMKQLHDWLSAKET